MVRYLIRDLSELFASVVPFFEIKSFKQSSDSRKSIQRFKCGTKDYEKIFITQMNYFDPSNKSDKLFMCWSSKQDGTTTLSIHRSFDEARLGLNSLVLMRTYFKEPSERKKKRLIERKKNIKCPERLSIEMQGHGNMQSTEFDAILNLILFVQRRSLSCIPKVRETYPHKLQENNGTVKKRDE